MRAVVVAADRSGSGKTTVSLALMAALTRRGLTVQPFKVGPDFIDPGHHALACGRESHNLDGWMLSREENAAIFNRYAAGADLAVIEGVMGLYDGFDPAAEDGSTAQMAKHLGAPVVLVVGAEAMARSVAALARGFVGFDDALQWVGLAANRVGGPGHARILAEAMAAVPELPFLGGLVRDEALAMPERHLGLVTAVEGGLAGEDLARLADWLEAGLDLDRLLTALPEVEPAGGEADPASRDGRPPVRLGVARDEAFCFYYPENLRRLEAAGAELVFFSPLADQTLPAGLDGLYLGGGYPELFAKKLSNNSQLRRQIYEFGRSGRPIYAECGGMMFLGRELVDLTGRSWPMAGLLPLSARMSGRLKSLGYREVTLAEDSILGPAGTVARGHEFHYSEPTAFDGDGEAGDGAYRVVGRKGPSPETKGYRRWNVLASYVHLHFGSNPGLAENFIAACWRAKG